MGRLSDVEFFHQGAMHICGTLDPNEMLAKCQGFLSRYMKITGLELCKYDDDTGEIGFLARYDVRDNIAWHDTYKLSKEAQDEVRGMTGQMRISNYPERSRVSKEMSAIFKLNAPSSVVCMLGTEDDYAGAIVVYCDGGFQYTEEHGRLLKLLHDPFYIAIRNILNHREVLRLQELLKDDNLYLHRVLHRLSGDEIIGADFGLSQVMEMIRQVAPTDSHVLLLGETGTGKEVIANAIHYNSARAKGPFIKVNCGAIPDSLIDSELFGHEKGAFTGAVGTRRGRFERADQGTIFLDEIGELPLPAQTRLLRVLQSREIERVGGGGPKKVDVRILAATHRNLADLVEKGSFRQDLYFRLNVFPIIIPSLRERKEDIPALVAHFIDRKQREMNLGHVPIPAPGAMERLKQHDWPGNVRELENTVERELIRHQSGDPGLPMGFSDYGLGVKPKKTSFGPTELKPATLDEVVARHIAEVMTRTGGKVQGPDGAAAVLGMHPSTLRHKMRKLGIAFGRS